MWRVTLAVPLALAACAGRQTELERAVREYDDALVRAYATADPSLLAAVAPDEEAVRVRVLIDLKSEAGVVLESPGPARGSGPSPGAAGAPPTAP